MLNEAKHAKLPSCVPCLTGGQAALEEAIEALLAYFQGKPLTPSHTSIYPSISLSSLHSACVAVLEALSPAAVAGARAGRAVLLSPSTLIRLTAATCA